MLKYAPGLAVVTLFSISLASANHAPTNVAFSVTKTIPHDGKSGTSGVTVELAPVAVDPDGDPMAFFWKCPASHTASVEVLTAVFPAAGSYTCELKVTDAHGATTTGAVSVTIITEPNATPVANAGADQTYTVPHDESPNSNTAGEHLFPVHYSPTWTLYQHTHPYAYTYTCA
jgi:PKD repeat protein